MTRIAFIGLGIMGAPMAANLSAAGHDVIGHNRSRPAVDRLVESGGKGAGSLAEVVEGSEVVISMLPDSPDVETVMLGDDGVLAHATPGVLHIDTRSIAPAAARTVIAAAGFASTCTARISASCWTPPGRLAWLVEELSGRGPRT